MLAHLKISLEQKKMNSFLFNGVKIQNVTAKSKTKTNMIYICTCQVTLAQCLFQAGLVGGLVLASNPPTIGVSKHSLGHSCLPSWEEAFRAQYGQLHNYNQRFQLLFVQNQLLEINCCRHISVNLARQAFISFFIV